jgi:hypothetical protein
MSDEPIKPDKPEFTLADSVNEENFAQMSMLRAEVDSKNKQLTEVTNMFQMALNNFKIERARLVEENEKLKKGIIGDCMSTKGWHAQSIEGHAAMLKNAEERERERILKCLKDYECYDCILKDIEGKP